jgi:hypothetical protein
LRTGRGLRCVLDTTGVGKGAEIFLFLFLLIFLYRALGLAKWRSARSGGQG